MRLLALVWPELRAPEADVAAFEPMLDRLDDLSPRVEAVAPGVALVDITGLGRLLGSERRIAARAVTLTREVAPLTVRCGVGENRWLAVLAARLARLERPDAPAAFRVLEKAELGELPLDLLPADPETRQRFALFGLTGMGQLATLPRSAVGAQFGPAGEWLQALARGEDPRPLRPRHRPEQLRTRVTFEPALDGIGAAALSLRRACAALCEQLRARHLAPGRARLVLELEGASDLALDLAFPAPALEPDWIARLLIGRLEAVVRTRHTGAVLRSGRTQEEPRVTSIGLTFDRLGAPASRQLPAFEAQAARWEELRWSVERLTARFGEGRLWRAVHDRPAASLAERRWRLVDIGPS